MPRRSSATSSSRPTLRSSAPARAAARPRKSSRRPGLAVILVEEGPLATAADFRMRESEAYPTLYQESAARKTQDKAIGILQGRCVGGGTTVNWTSSFRTPESTLAQWQRVYGLSDFGPDDLAPWFERMEARLGDRALGRGARTPTTKRWRAVRRSSAFPRPRSGATSRAAGISVTAAWGARPTRSSRCWSRRCLRRLIAARSLVTRARALEFAHSRRTRDGAVAAQRWMREACHRPPVA